MQECFFMRLAFPSSKSLMLLKPYLQIEPLKIRLRMQQGFQQQCIKEQFINIADISKDKLIQNEASDLLFSILNTLQQSSECIHLIAQKCCSCQNTMQLKRARGSHMQRLWLLAAHPMQTVAEPMKAPMMVLAQERVFNLVQRVRQHSQVQKERTNVFGLIYRLIAIPPKRNRLPINLALIKETVPVTRGRRRVRCICLSRWHQRTWLKTCDDMAKN